MPRRNRIAIPNLPHHIVQRGHNRGDVFFSDSDRIDYLGTMGECRARFGIRFYAYCLMSNHIHLIVDPGEAPRAISATMHRLAGRHARRLNERHGRSGSVWESRFYCSPIDTDRYLLACGRYIDQNPVRARIVNCAAEFAWSSYRHRAGLDASPLLDPDPAILSFSSTQEKALEAYRALVAVAVSPQELTLIREAYRRNRPTGDEAFVEDLRSHNDLALPRRPRGRPPKRAAA